MGWGRDDLSMPLDLLDPPTSSAVGSEVHERIAQRRSLVQAERRRRRGIRACIVAIPVLIAAAVVALAHSPLFDVDRIDVVGAESTSLQTILEAAGISEGEPMYRIEGGSVARSLERLATIESAEVRTTWPGLVSIELVEREPVLSIRPTGGQWHLVDGEGHVMAQTRRPAARMVAADGYEGTVEVGQRLGREGRTMAAVAAALPGTIARATDALAITDRARVVLYIDDIAVWVGDETNLEAKIEALLAVMDQVEMTGVCEIDIRVARRPAVNRACAQ